MPKLIIRQNGAQNLRDRCGVILNRELGAQIGLHPAQVSRVLSGRHDPGNRFIAGVIERCGLEYTFAHVFELADGDL